jgi:uncharacterized phage protein (TIGR02220 family)
MEYFKVKNFDKYQPKRNGKHAPWIRLYHNWTADYAIGQLTDSQKAQWVVLLCIAHGNDNVIPRDTRWIKTQGQLSSNVDLKKFEMLGLIEPLSDKVFSTKTEKSPEKEKEKEKGGEKKEKGEGELNPESLEVLNYLNLEAGKNFQPTDKNMGFIDARLNQYGKQALFHVVDVKVAEWKDDPKWDTYLRPSTLFNAEKCETYVNQKLGLDKKTETLGSKKMAQVKRLLKEGPAPIPDLKLLERTS